MKTKIVQNIKTIILALILTLCVGYVSAYSTWVGPTAAAPLNNTDTPLNTGSSSQIKIGNLLIKATGLVNGLIVENGKVGIGTITPTQKLSVAGVIESTTGGIMFPDGTIQTTAAVGGGSVSSTIYGSGASMSLPTGTYKVMVWGTYSTCYNVSTNLLLDGSVVKTFPDVGGDQEGCDQNTIMALKIIQGGSHTWLISGGAISTNQDFLWIAIPSLENPLYGGSHTSSDCTSVGGTVVNVEGKAICKMSGSSCLSGWTKYNNYSTTVASMCTGETGTCTSFTPLTCMTGYHAFGNLIAETCTYYNQSKGLLGCPIFPSAKTCSAVVSQIGCY